MSDLSSQILPRLKAHRTDAFPMDEDMMLPYYQGLSLVNLPATVCSLLDVPIFGQPPLEEGILARLGGPYEKVVFLLVDALGYSLFNKMRQPAHQLLWNRYFDQGTFAPLTSICPSTTASALTTFWTGEGAAVHGVVGYEMWAKEFGMVINNILHSASSGHGDVGGLVRSGFDPATFLNRRLLGTHLVEHGISPTTFIHSSIAHSGLSTMQMADVNIRTYVDEADMCVSLAQHLNTHPGVREFIYVYYSDIDTLMHRFNADDLRVALQFEAFSNLLEKAVIDRLSPQVARDTLLVLTADHGSKATPKYDRFDLRNHPGLVEHLVMQPTCEHRLAFFYIKPGKVQAVRDYFAKTWPEDFYLVDPDTALESGLFGPGPFRENIRDRMGDLMAVGRGDSYLWWAPKPNLMAGRHGGLSEEEMLVPFFALPLGSIL